MDETFKYDKDVRKWVKKTIYPQHNLIIKTKDGCYCTNCGKTFFTKNKINIETICPKCKATLLIKSKTLKNYKYVDDFRILEYINGYFVIRGFEVMSIYSDMKFTHYVSEYQRLVIDKNKNYLLLSNKFKSFMYTCHVSHIEKQIRWRLHDNYTSSWYYSSGTMYLGNIENDIKNTVYQYCNLLSNNIDYTKAESITLLQKILNNPTSYELLNKLGLINLSTDCDKFAIKGSFEKDLEYLKNIYHL